MTTFHHQGIVNYPATLRFAQRAQESKEHPLTRSSPPPFRILLPSLPEAAPWAYMSPHNMLLLAISSPMTPGMKLQRRQEHA